MNRHWNELAKARLTTLGMTQAELAEELGVTQGAMGHWLNGRRSPSLPEVGRIFDILGIKHASLNADGSFTLEQDLSLPEVKPQYLYPLYSHVQAGALHDMPLIAKQDAIDWIATAKCASRSAFWLKVPGHSMTAPQGSSPSFPEGILILVDPDEAENVKPGDFCVTRFNEEVTFKQFQRYAGQPLLEPLNPRYDNIPLTDGFRIIGKVVAAQWPQHIFD